MPDITSRYRVVRLALHVPTQPGSRAHYSLIAVGVKRGIPDARILADGTVPLAPNNPTTEEILEALDAAIRQHML